MKYLMIILPLVFAGCADVSDPIQQVQPISKVASHEHTSAKAPNNYQKPGADIHLAQPHIYNVKQHELFEMPLSLKSSLKQGLVTVEITVQNGLELLSDAPTYTFNLSDNHVMDIPLQLSGASEGRYIVNIFANISDGEQSQSRAMAAIVNVGDVQQKPKVPGNDSGVISLPATETIN